ncbi:MAG: UDP-N-acetylmuramoyl-L-alanyl-D-glutamate--2,6-diaminopimelate ligase [Patescibacteria group bacterium]
MDALLTVIKRFFPRAAFVRLQPLYHFFLAYAAAVRFWFPGRHLTVIGITGTKGKTTIVRLVHEVLSASGVGVMSASSLSFRIKDVETPNALKMTMPGRFFVQRLLRQASNAGCRYAVLEVTSQGIVQFRHRAIPFSGAVMTNIAPEHIESHGGFEPYLRAKLDLFWRLPKGGAAVINRDDPHSARFSAATSAHKIFYGKDAIVIGAKQWKISDVVIGADGIGFAVAGVAVRSPLLGMFNFYNILAAVAVGLSEGIALERIADAVVRVAGVPGRMEFVARSPVAVVVDYAHTPDSLKNVYTFLRQIPNPKSQIPKKRKGKLICVLGAAGGGRDTWKRPAFGAIAERYCDDIILTNEDPYDEDPEAIVGEIGRGISKNFEKIIDRGTAIRAAITRARAGDTVVITGKGAELWIMGPKGSKLSWDDRRVVREALNDGLPPAETKP